MKKKNRDVSQGSPEISLLPFLLEDDTDYGTHDEFVDECAQSKEQVDTQHPVPTQSVWSVDKKY